jgi:hypothetical protein
MSTVSDEKKSYDARDESLERGSPDIVKRSAHGLKLEPQPSDDPAGEYDILTDSRRSWE